MKQLSSTRIKNLRSQGYVSQSTEELGQIAIGNRFTHQLGAVLLIIGIIKSSVIMLGLMLLVSFLAIVLPRHPFDHIYNYGVSKLIRRPRLPERTMQWKFACMLATVWIGAAIMLVYNDLILESYVVTSLLIVDMLLVSTLDYCISSQFYNYLFSTKSSS